MSNFCRVGGVSSIHHLRNPQAVVGFRPARRWLYTCARDGHDGLNMGPGTSLGRKVRTMSEKEHIWIPKLKQQLADKKIDRREFIRYSTLLGMSAGTAYLWAGKITGEPIAQPALA